MLKQTTEALRANMASHTQEPSKENFFACFTGEMKSIQKSICAINTLFSLLDDRLTHQNEILIDS